MPANGFSTRFIFQHFQQTFQHFNAFNNFDKKLSTNYLTHKDEDSSEPYSLDAHREFDSLNDAYKVFEKLSSWIIYGFYDFYHRREYLLTDAMK